MPGSFRFVVVALLLVWLLAAGCTAGTTVGSGNMITEPREVSGFDEIVLLGSGDVFVEVTGTESLQIQAEDNIVPLVTTEVVNRRLELGSRGSYSTSRGITYTITAVELVGVTIRGSGDVSGAGIDTDSFEVSIEGSGRVDLAGASDDLTVEISGSGDFDGRNLESATSTVTVAGSGDVLVDVTEDLTVEISGSGDVEYIGDPTLHEAISGSGHVSRR